MSEEIGEKDHELLLIHLARQDPNIFGELYRLYVERIYRYAYSQLGNTLQAEDITSQTFLSAFESFDRFKDENHFSSWLFSIAHHKIIDALRQQKGITCLNEDIESSQDKNDPTEELIQSEQINSLNRIICSLPEEEKELLRLRFLAKLNYSEIAHFLHRKEEAVKKSTYRLLVRLHDQMEVSHE